MPTQTRHIDIIGPRDGEAVNVLGAPITIKSGGQTDQMFFADHPVPVGYGVPLHEHLDEDELFYVLEGRITLDSEAGSTVAGPGSFVHLPRGVPHGYRNEGPDPARMLVVTTPGGALEGVFRGLDAAARGPEPLEGPRVAAICAASRVTML